MLHNPNNRDDISLSIPDLVKFKRIHQHVPSINSLQKKIIMPISQLSIIDVLGEDAKIFLHHMLSNNVIDLHPDEVRSAALCSATGRVIATIDYWQIDICNNTKKQLSSDSNLSCSQKYDQGIRLALSADLCDEVIKLLKRFTFRSKIIILHYNSIKLFGYSCPEQDTSHTPITTMFFLDLKENKKKELHQNTMHTTDNQQHCNQITVLRMRNVYINHLLLKYYLIIFHTEKPMILINEKYHDACLSNLEIAQSTYWDWLNIRAGKVQIVKKTSNLFTPHMLNFDLTGVIDFQKGCYPGQEIIARTHYRGKSKRRTKLIQTSKAQILDNIYLNTQYENPVGQVLMAAPSLTQDYDCLVMLLETNIEKNYFYIEGNMSKSLIFLELPY